MGMTIARQPTNACARKIFGRRGLLVCSLLLNAGPAFSASLSTGATITLAWNQSPDTNVVGYNIYYGTASHTYTSHIQAGTATSASIPGLVAGVAYYFAATSRNAAGQESGFSNETSNTVLASLPALLGRRAPTGQFILTVNGPAGQTNQILATPDLKTWTVIGTVALGSGGALNFTDQNAAAFPQRFYRTQKAP